MKVKIIKNPLIFLMMVMLFLAGCATTATPPQAAKRYLWPRPPVQPRIEWLKSYYGQNDYPKSAFTEFVEIIFGEPQYRLFQKPLDITSNGKGTVYVTDSINNGIFVFDLPGQQTSFWQQGSDPDAGLAITPFYIAIDADGNIYTVGTGRKEIFVLDPGGKLVRRINFSAVVESPAGIVVSNKLGRIYLVDGGGFKVAVFDLLGKHLFSFGKPGGGDGEFNRPSPITINSKGEVIVGDTHNARVQIFDPDGKFLRKFGERGDSPSTFQIMKGVATDSDDNIYVTDGKANQVKIYSDTGAYLMTIGAAF